MTSVRLKAGIQPGGSMSDSARTLTGSGQTDESRDLQSRFIEQNLRRIFLQIYRMVGNVDDAQDLTQETFIKALQRRDQIKDLDKAAHWLSRIATNTAIDYLRRHGKVNFTEISELPQPLSTEPEASPERLLLQAEGNAVLQDGLLTLSVRERTALVMRDVDDIPSREVAKALRCSEATVRSHIANARVKFRKFLEGRKS